jgi:LacI family purine nucleotide synthesis repressor
MRTDSPSKPVTLQDVARATGISLATASLAMNGKGRVAAATREAVLETARELGFEADTLAQRLATGRCHKTIALFSLQLDNGTGVRKLQHIQELLAGRGYDLPIFASSYGMAREVKQQTALLSTMLRQRPRAVLCSTFDLQLEALPPLQQYQNDGGRLVCYDAPTALGCDKVVFDRAASTYQAARHLLELGHRKIAFLCSTGEHPGGPRLEGFERALTESGVAVHQEWLWGSRMSASYTGGAEELGAHLAQRFLRLKERPTAVCLENDYSAVAFAAELQRAGVRVPDEVSVVGDNDDPIARYGPLPLTTVTQPVAVIARHVVELLQSRLAGYEGAPRRIELHGELVVRQSAAPPQRTN